MEEVESCLPEDEPMNRGELRAGGDLSEDVKAASCLDCSAATFMKPDRRDSWVRSLSVSS